MALSPTQPTSASAVPLRSPISPLLPSPPPAHAHRAGGRLSAGSNGNGQHTLTPTSSNSHGGGLKVFHHSPRRPQNDSPVISLLCTLLGYADSSIFNSHVSSASFEWLREQSGCVAAYFPNAIDVDAPLQLYLKQLLFEKVAFNNQTTAHTSPPPSLASSALTNSSTSSSTVSNFSSSPSSPLTTFSSINSSLSTSSSGAFDSLCFEVRRRHFDSFTQKKALTEFLNQNKEKLGLKDVTLTSKEIQALYLISGKYSQRLCEELLLQRSLQDDSNTPTAFPSGDAFIHAIKVHVDEFEKVRNLEVEFFHRYLTQTKNGSSLLFVGIEETQSITPNDVFQLLELVAHATNGAHGELPTTVMSGLLLMSVLQSFSESTQVTAPLFENLAELRQGVQSQLSYMSTAYYTSLQQALNTLAHVESYEFDDWSQSMQLDGFSIPLLHALWLISPWMNETDRPFSLELFKEFCVRSAVAYATTPNETEHKLVHVYLTQLSHPLTSFTIPSATITALFETIPTSVNHRGALLILYLELLSENAVSYATTSPDKPVYSQVDTFLTAVSQLHLVHDAEMAFVSTTLAKIDHRIDATQCDKLLDCFRTSLRLSLASYLSTSYPTSPLRLFLYHFSTEDSSSANNLFDKVAAFHLDWNTSKRLIHLLLMSLPITSIASSLSSRSILHPTILLTDLQLDELMCLGQGRRRTWTLLLHMQQLLEKEDREKDWAGFLARFQQLQHDMRGVSVFMPADPNLHIVHHLFLMYLSAPFSRLLPPQAVRLLTIVDLDRLEKKLTSTSSSTLTFTTAFHFLLQLDSLDFPNPYLCESWNQLLEMIDSARIESAAKEKQLFDHLLAPSCLLFTPINQSDSTPTYPFQLCSGNIDRFSSYIGGGVMTVAVFRALGLEVRSTDSLPFGCFSRFLRRARLKIAQLSETELDNPTASETAKDAAAKMVVTTSPITPRVLLGSAAFQSPKQPVPPSSQPRAPATLKIRTSPSTTTSPERPIELTNSSTGSSSSVLTNSSGDASSNGSSSLSSSTNDSSSGVASSGFSPTPPSNPRPTKANVAVHMPKKSLTVYTSSSSPSNGSLVTSPVHQRTGSSSQMTVIPDPVDDKSVMDTLASALIPSAASRLTHEDLSIVRIIFQPSFALAKTVTDRTINEAIKAEAECVVDAKGGHVGFDSLERLIVALRARQLMDLPQRRQLVEYLNSVSSTLFLQPPPSPFSIVDVNELLTRANMGANVMMHLKEFEKVAVSSRQPGQPLVFGFKNLNELIQVLISAHTTHTQTLQREKSLSPIDIPTPIKLAVEVAPPPPTRLGTYSSATTPQVGSPSQLLSSSRTAGLKSSTSFVLPSPSSHASLMTNAVAQVGNPASLASSVTKEHVFDFLASPTCPFWSIPVLIQWSDVEKLIQTANRSPAQLWVHLQYILQLNRKFDSVAALQMAILKLARVASVGDNAAFFSQLQLHAVDETQPVQPAPPQPIVLPQIVAPIMEENTFLIAPNVKGAPSTSSSGTSSPQKFRHQRTMSNRISPRPDSTTTTTAPTHTVSDLLQHLNEPNCSLWPRGARIRVTSEQVEMLCRQGKGVTNTMSIINTLEETKQKFHAFNELIIVVGRLSLRAG